ncbi:MAG: hypothetical protein K6A65_07520 [Succinivibrionaceae bacterium]|nr:hypothetical protein [Succinivibrionaceae bacterium]
MAETSKSKEPSKEEIKAVIEEVARDVLVGMGVKLLLEAIKAGIVRWCVSNYKKSDVMGDTELRGQVNETELNATTNAAASQEGNLSDNSVNGQSGDVTGNDSSAKAAEQGAEAAATDAEAVKTQAGALDTSTKALGIN